MALDEAEARRLFDAGKGRNEIAKTLGVGAASVTRWANREGIAFDRAATAQAVAAKVIDAKARRLGIVARLYDRAETLLNRLEAPEFTTLVRGAQGRENERTLKFVPPQNERDLASSMSTYLTSAAKLEAIDATPEGTTEAESVLDRLEAGFEGEFDGVDDAEFGSPQ